MYPKLKIDYKERERSFWFGFWVGICTCSVTLIIGCLLADYIKLLS